MSILSTSPTNTRMFDAEIAAALGDINAAVIVQQLNYWMQKDSVGTTIDGVKYVYNTFVEWVNQQFPWLSVWQFRKAMSLLRSLGIVKVIRHKARQWNQTNFYTLDGDRLAEFLSIEIAQSTEISEMCDSSPQLENNQHLEMRDTKVSIYRTKNTLKEEQQSNVAATSFENSKADLRTTEPKPNSVTSSADPDKEKENIFSTKQNTGKGKTTVEVEYLVNLKWKEQIKDLDSAGIPVNKTLIELLKSYKSEEVESAIALFKTRKREKYIPNPTGYFVSALKGNWAGQRPHGGQRDFKSRCPPCGESAVTDNSSNVDEASIFRYWYDLARQLGYCSGFEVRDNEQWVCLSGTWERWKDAVERGYSLDYLKNILKRNQGR